MSVLFSFLFFSPHKTGHLTKGKKMYCEILSWRKKGKWQQENSQVKESFYWHSCTFKQKLDLTNTSSRICHLLQWSSQNTKVKMSPACEDGFTPLSRTRFDVSRQSEGLIYWKSARRSVLLLPEPFPYMSFLTLLALFLTDLGGSCLSVEEMVDLMWCSTAAAQLKLYTGTNKPVQ